MSKVRILVALVLVLTACGVDDSVSPQTSPPEITGGTSSTATTTVVGETGGNSSSSTGGTSTVSTTVGGSALQASGGAGPSSTGGATLGTGGSVSTGGASANATGGSTPQATGGSPSTGGASTADTGGSSPQSTGGSTTDATGGSTYQATGGSPSTGGSTTTTTGGSTQATGGSSTTGGSPATGGLTSTGGSPATGGTPATGGSSTTATGGSTSVPTPVPTQISVGTNQTCVVLSDGHVKCWGNNTYGQLGNGTTTDSATPVLVNGISNAVQVSTYNNHTCALLADGTVWCWGRNEYGQLGNGVAGYEGSTPLAPTPSPVQMLGVTGALQVTTGGYTTCVILADHTVKCLGYRRYGELGDGVDGDVNNYYSKVLVQVVGIDNATSISSNTSYSCALLSDKTIKCWGQPKNEEFPLPTGTFFSSTPVLIPSATNAAQLSVGNSTICYLTTSSQVFCLGALAYSYGVGALPPGGNISFYPAKLAIGGSHACALYNRPALTTEAYIGCWGSNYSGEISNGIVLENSQTVLVPGITDAIDVAVGEGSSSCAILRSGTVKCWGQLTGNSSAPTSSTPVIPDGF